MKVSSVKMVLVDTSVWIDYLRNGDALLSELLIQQQVVMHPFVIGELILGNLSNRKELLNLWMNLPSVSSPNNLDVFEAIESQRLFGKGIGFVDAHLLVSCAKNNTKLWTRDKRLQAIAQTSSLAYVERH